MGSKYASHHTMTHTKHFVSLFCYVKRKRQTVEDDENKVEEKETEEVTIRKLFWNIHSSIYIVHVLWEYQRCNIEKNRHKKLC